MTSLPPELQYGHVVGRVILAVADSGDADAYPDAVPAQGTVTFTPKNPEVRVGEPDPVVVLKQKIVCTIDSAGYLTDPDGKRGVWLVTGVYTVSYTFNAAALPAHDIVVGAEHTLASPLDLTLALPPGGPALQPSQYAELTARIDSLVFEAAGVSSVNGATGDVILDAEDVGALPSSYTPPAQSWEDVTGKPATFAPTAHAASHATGGSDPIAPADIGAATATQGAKADSAVQPADVDDVIREGDARLTDARTPTGHTHAYADITDPPTIPGPQTLSLTGSDLTLSDGGGTVTLPSGGGGSSSSELEGTGSPEGSVAASPGVYYTDTAGTNGAWRWLKRTGTGMTGWSVVYGDTGWRDVTTLCFWHSTTTYLTGSGLIYMRMTEDGVRLRCGYYMPPTGSDRLRIPPLKPWLENRLGAYNAGRGLPLGLEEYFGDIAIANNLTPQAATSPAVWSLDRHPTWPTTLPGIAV